jgi:hypothetical protein
MSKLFTTGLLAGFTLTIVLTPAHADASPQQCDARRVQYLIGEYMTIATREEARKVARATHVVANSLLRDIMPNRLKLETDYNLRITGAYCG